MCVNANLTILRYRYRSYIVHELQAAISVTVTGQKTPGHLVAFYLLACSKLHTIKYGIWSSNRDGLPGRKEYQKQVDIKSSCLKMSPHFSRRRSSHGPSAPVAS